MGPAASSPRSPRQTIQVSDIDRIYDDILKEKGAWLRVMIRVSHEDAGLGVPSDVCEEERSESRMGV